MKSPSLLVSPESPAVVVAAGVCVWGGGGESRGQKRNPSDSLSLGPLRFEEGHRLRAG
jgi:hypothetical protein